MELRTYQKDLVRKIGMAFKEGHMKVMGFSATGSGKSVVTKDLIERIIGKNKRICFLVRRKQLVIDSYRKFEKYGASMLMATDKRYDPTKALQICSIDTVSRRTNVDYMYDFDYVIVDECHDTVSPKYRSFLAKFSNKTRYIGLTATPFEVSGKPQDFWDVCVKAIEIQDLIDEDYLVKTKVYCPSTPNLSGAKVRLGDYATKDLAEIMGAQKVIGDVVQSYIDFGENKSGLCFAVNVEHSKKLCKEFNDKGIKAEHCDANTPQEERDAVLNRFKTGETKIITNCNIFSTGVDLPRAEVGIMARPTKSTTLYIQQVGRLLRPYRVCGACKKEYDNSSSCYHCGASQPEYIKPYAIILDNGNNVLEHGLPEKKRDAVLVEKEKKKKKKDADGNEIPEEIPMKICDTCFAPYLAHKKQCPECGAINQKPMPTIETEDGELVPYSEYSHILTTRDLLQAKAKIRGYKQVWVQFQLYEKFGDACFKYKELKFPKWLPEYAKKGDKK